jgi:hypothetical protein
LSSDMVSSSPSLTGCAGVGANTGIGVGVDVGIGVGVDVGVCFGLGES